jgi:signal transduction histidine kinase/ActR/RegA family two-component response regulator
LSSLRFLALLCLVLPLVIYAIVGAYSYRQIRAETEVRLDRAARIAQEHALKVLDSNDSVLARVLEVLKDADAIAVAARERELHQQLKAMSSNKPQIQSLWVWAADGRALATDRFHPARTDVEVADRDDFKWHRDNGGGLFLSELLAGRGTGSAFFDMSRGRYLADGSFAGAVSVSVGPTYFERFHSDLAADEPGLAITMLREDGTIYTRWPRLATAPRKLAAGSPVMTRIRAGDTSGTAHGVSSVDGRERLLTFRKVGDYPVYVGTGMDVSEVRRRWATQMAWLGAFGLPPLLGLYLAGRVALRRTRDALDAAARLQEETQARRRVEEALLQAQKLEALGRLTGGVAHDFNNALMVISNNLFLLKRRHPDAEGPQLESIGRAVGSATKLTRQLLAFSRRQALVPEYMLLQERLPTLQDLLGPVLGSQIQFSMEVAPDTRPILVDAAEFELALINLAINARDAMPDSGSFAVSARNVQPGELPPLLHGDMVVVDAADTGTGIDAETLGKVFEPFFTTKPVGEGTGLGLSQVYGLCQRAGGTAVIESELGNGSRVRLFVPAAEVRGARTEAGAVSTHRHLGKKVLLVEDNDEVAAALQPVLEDMGCQVVRLHRAGAGRDWLLGGNKPDVLLTDVVMPGDMNGLALAEFTRAQFPAVGIVVMTGYAEQIERIAGLGFEIVPKPCSADMLAEAVERVTRRGAPPPAKT